MDIQLADVTVHFDPDLDADQRRTLEDSVRALDGVISYHNPDTKPHLAVVEYDPAKVSSGAILAAVTDQGIHAELIGL